MGSEALYNICLTLNSFTHQGVALRIFCCPFRALQFRGGRDSFTQGVALGYVLLPIRGADIEMGEHAFTHGSALGYVLLPLRD